MKKSVIISFHIVYWLLYALFIIIIVALLNGLNSHSSQMTAQSKTLLWQISTNLTFVPAIIAFYTFYTLLFDYFLSKRKILGLFISGFAVAFLSGFMGAVGFHMLSLFGIGFSPFGQGWEHLRGNIFIMAIIALPNGGMGLIVKGFIRWYADLKVKEDLMKKNFETELALVKSQLDPHFLFNTLNNIDTLILKDADVASKYLNKLSDILRFMLYETKGSQLLLTDEWAYIEKYTELQKIRTSNPDFADLNLGKNTEGVVIAPMILIPFVENAFKHAGWAKTGNVIRISAVVENGSLQFECSNRLNKQNIDSTRVGGLGNGLIMKRLELLYPQKHTLKVVQDLDFYHIFLHIDLT